MVNGAGGVNPQPKVSLEQLAKLADVNGDQVVQGQEVMIFDNAVAAAGVESSSEIKIGDYVIMRSTTKDDKNGQLDAETYKDSRGDVGFAKEHKNSRAEKQNIMIMCQQGVSNIVKDFMGRVPAEQQSAFINYLDSQLEGQFQPGRYKTKAECEAAMKDFYARVQAEFNNKTIIDTLKDFEAKTEQQHTETREVMSNQIDKLKQELTVQLSELQADMGERFDKLDAGQLQILAEAKKNGAGIAELRTKANELLEGQGKLGEQIDGATAEIKDVLGKKIDGATAEVKDHVTADGEKTRAQVQLSARQTAALQAASDNITRMLDHEKNDLTDSDYRDSTVEWIGAKVVEIVNDDQMSFDSKMQLLKALETIIDTEAVVTSYQSGLSRGDKPVFEQAMQDARDGKLNPDWKWDTSNW